MINIQEIFFKKINKLQLVSLFFIVFVFFAEVLSPWFSVLKSFFESAFFEKNHLEYVMGESFSVHSKMLTFGFLLILTMIFKRTIGLLLFAIILFISFFTDLYHFMDETIHPLLFNTGIFSTFVRNNVNGINPQYTRLTLFVIVSIILLVMVFLKKLRTIDRSFVVIISMSIMITTFIFHVAIPMGILKYAKKEHTERFIEEIYNLPTSYVCRNKTCLLYDEKFNEISEKFLGNRELAQQFAGFIDASKDFYSHPENRINPIYGNSGNFTGVVSIFHICIYKNNEGKDSYFCVIDDNAMKDYGKFSQLWFSFLTSVAHGVWLFGGMLLLALHKSRKIKKLAGSNS